LISFSVSRLLSTGLAPSKTGKKAFIIDAYGLELANKLQQKCVAKACADWIEHKVDIKMGAFGNP